MIKHFLNFISSGHGMVELENEPIGLDRADFGFEQSDRLGRDISYGPMEFDLHITRFAYPRTFELMLYNDRMFGYEAHVEYIIQLTDEVQYKKDVDFYSLETDQKENIYFKANEVNYNVLIDRRRDVPINIFGTKDLDGNPIVPVQTHNLLMRAKPITAVSKWQTPQRPEGHTIANVVGVGGAGGNQTLFFNYANLQVEYGISNTLSYIQGTGDKEDFGYIYFENNAKDVTLRIHKINVNNYGNGNGEGRVELRYFIGDELPFEEFGEFIKTANISNNETANINNEEVTITIPFVERGKKLWIWYRSFAQAANNSTTFGLVTTVHSLDIDISATGISYNTVVPAVRLIDVMRYVVKAAAGLEISAPRWDCGKQFYNQFLTSTSLMRRLGDKPFLMTFKRLIEDYMPEVFGGYQIQPDRKVFFGIYEDFYADYQCGDYTYIYDSDNVQVEGFKVSKNEDLAINVFKYKYETYASQRESETENTYDLVHGESEWLLNVKRVQNKKEVTVGFIRDAFFIDLQRTKALSIKDNTATQDDDKVFIIDGYQLDAGKTFTETSVVRHRADGNYLTLVIGQTDGEVPFKWSMLGLQFYTNFIIHNTENAGEYSISGIGDTELLLFNGGASPIDISEVNTQYTYSIEMNVTYVNRIDEGFAEIANLNGGTRYGNLNFSIKRNILNYYNRFLASCSLYTNEAIVNTRYDKNPAALTRIISETEAITEGEPFIPDNPILDAYIYKVKFTMNMTEFLRLENQVRNKNGWIKFFDAEGFTRKGYIKEIKFTALSGMSTIDKLAGEVNAVLEEKYQPFLIQIFGTFNGMISINGTNYSNDFEFRFDDYGKISIFDETGKRLTKPIPFNKIKVNNSAPASTPSELANWLMQLKDN